MVFMRDLDPNTWPGVREISKDSDEFRSQADAWRINAYYAECLRIMLGGFPWSIWPFVVWVSDTRIRTTV